MGETKIIYYVDGEQTPYLIKVATPPDQVTLADFKNAVPAINRPNYKYFFRSDDDDFGVVKEEIVRESQNLPLCNNRVVGWVVTTESSDTSSQCASEVAPSGERGPGIGDSRPPSFHAAPVTSSKPSEVDSSSKHGGKHSNKRRENISRHQRDATSSMLSSDLDSTSFVDSDEDSRLSTTTDQTRSTRHKRRKRKTHRLPPMSRASSFSSITDSTMSLNIITVVLNLDTVNFLGISIVGQSNKGGDGGIYVGSIMKGGAVAQDGRIEPGDMILEVNNVSFENMCNDDAVRALREAVQKPGPITLVVAKCWDPNPKGYFTVPRQEPVRPIDPSAWVAHTEAVAATAAFNRNQNVSSTSSSVTSGSSLQENSELNLSKSGDMEAVVKALAQPDSGLEIRDRMWLKITIPNAFIGSDLVDWLHNHVDGFSDRREARKYAASLLRAGFIRHTVNKVSFSEQCYYVLASDAHGPLPPVWPNESLSSTTNSTLIPQVNTNLSNLTLEDIDSVSEVAGHNKMPTWNDAYNTNPYGPSYPAPSAPAFPTQNYYPPPPPLPPQNYAPPPRYDVASYTSVNGAESVQSGKHDQTCACIATHLGKQIKKLWENPEKGGTTSGAAAQKFDAEIVESTSSESGSSISGDSQNVQHRPLPRLPSSADENIRVMGDL